MKVHIKRLKSKISKVQNPRNRIHQNYIEGDTSGIHLSVPACRKMIKSISRQVGVKIGITGFKCPPISHLHFLHYSMFVFRYSIFCTPNLRGAPIPVPQPTVGLAHSPVIPLATFGRCLPTKGRIKQRLPLYVKTG